MKERLEQDPMYVDVLLPAAVFPAPDSARLPDEPSVNRLWNRVKHILRAANECDSYQKDENAWSEVVRLVLRTAMFDFAVHLEEETLADLDVTNIQSQAIDRQFLPRFQSAPGYCDRRTDLAVAFHPHHAEYGSLRQAVCQVGLPLSHMKDAYSSTVALAHPVEIKAANGNAEEAQLQLAVFHASASVFLQRVPQPPMLGWTVIGHKWTLFIAWTTTSGTVVEVRSPSLSRNVGTTDAEALFTLLAVLRSGFEWLRQHYWPKYAAMMETKLAKSAPL